MSYENGQHPLFKYTIEDQQEIWKELGIKPSSIQQDVDSIYEWFQKQPHLVGAGIEREFIERMIINAKGSPEKAKQRIDNYYKYRSLAPELIQDRESILTPGNDIWTFYRQAAIPRLFHGKRISVLRFEDVNPKLCFTEVLFKNTLMLGDIRLRYDYVVGDIWIIDLKNVTFGHFLKVNPSCFQKATNIFQEGMGIRVFAIHVLNAPSFSQQIFNFLKAFIKPKLLERVKMHETCDELQKYIPPKYLPKDYGGDELSIEEFKELYEKEICRSPTRDFLIDRCNQTSDESKRAGENTNEEYISGSFKKLELD